MNPSVDEILNAIERLNSDNIIILPNNKNIILAAEQARELTKKTVEVLPTMNIPQGIAAALAFIATESYAANVENMRAAFDEVKCGQITSAIRNTKMDGFSIKVGDIIGVDDKKVIAKTSSIDETAKKIIAKLMDADRRLITLYYGEGVTEEQAENLAAAIQELYPGLDIMTQNGGQPHYYYMISLE